MILTIIIFLIMLSLLVFVHELGHFLTARKMGIEVEEFGFGFPPRVVGWKRGKTIYSLNWIPLGGFVKIKGESGEHADEKNSFSSRSALQRSVILLAGVAMNVVLAAVLLSVGFGIGLPRIVDDDLPRGAEVSNLEIQFIRVLENSPADVAGLKFGDTLLDVNGEKFAKIEQVQSFIRSHADQELAVHVRRDGEELTVSATPKVLSETNAPALGVSLAAVGVVSYPPHQAVWHGIRETGFFLKEIVVSIAGLIKGVLVGRPTAVDVAGPVGIAVLTHSAIAQGFAILLQFAAILSLNLAIVNALPIPALDGGRFLFVIIEKIRGRPVGRKLEAAIHNVAFLLLIGLVILVTARDIGRFSGTIGSVIRSLFGN